MKKYVLTGITDYAKRHLTVEDIEYLEEMEGCEIEEYKDGLYILPDGETAHSDFINTDQLAKERCK